MESKRQKQYFVEQLLQWYAENKRDLPWRKTRDPYKIWVSEIMLQQTRVDTVIPYYERFLSKFPTLDALAEAPEEEVLKSWEGLGYYSRARNLHAAVKEVKAKYNSKVPDQPESFRTLKGVGPYTAGAVLSIAFNKPEPAVDGNVLRVMSRYFLIEKDIAKSSTRVHMENIVREIIPRKDAGSFNQALMELGAVVCTPRSPQCGQCPVMEYCGAYQEGKEESLPVKTKARPPRPEYRLVLLAEGQGQHEGCVLLRRRPETGLLAGMWEPPHFEMIDSSMHRKTASRQKETKPSEQALIFDQNRLMLYFKENYGLSVQATTWHADMQHIFSHIQWNLRVFIGTCSASELPDGWSWVHQSELTRLTFPNVFNKLLKSRGWLE